MSADISIHRLLDEAFAGVTMTPDLQDLKEELRGSLATRAAELQAAGADASAAATTAVAELGDIREIVNAVADEGADDAVTGTSRAGQAGPAMALAADLVRRHRVKPAPAFVVRTVLLALVVAAIAVLLGLVVAQVVTGPVVTDVVLAVLLGVAVGLLVADALRQETTLHFASPRRRATGWGISGGALGAGLGLGAGFAAHPEAVGVLVAAIVVALAGILGLVWFGVTQTNRTKPWALAMNRQAAAEDRFSQDPAAAARFGIYTVVIWVAGIALFVVLSLTVGFAWSWLAIVATLLVFFLVLARMDFPAGTRSDGRGRPTP
jgi:MFS family permease